MARPTGQRRGAVASPARPVARPARPASRPARPARPTRPDERTRTTAKGRPAQRPTTTKRPSQARPHRAPAKSSRQHGRSWATGTFVRRVRLVRLILILALVLMMARLVQVQVLKAGGYEAAARGESSITVSLPSLAWWDLRPGRFAARTLGGNRRRGGRRLPGRAPGADGARALAHAWRAGGDVGHGAAPSFGLRGVGQAALDVDRSRRSRADALPGITLHRRCQASRAQRQPGRTGGRFHPCRGAGCERARVPVQHAAGRNPWTRRPSWSLRLG